MDRQLCRSQWCQSALADGWWQTIWLCVSQRLEYRSLSFEHLNEESVPGRFEPTQKKTFAEPPACTKFVRLARRNPWFQDRLGADSISAILTLSTEMRPSIYLVCINPSLWACFLFRLLDPGNTRRVSETSPASNGCGSIYDKNSVNGSCQENSIKICCQNEA